MVKCDVLREPFEAYFSVQELWTSEYFKLLTQKTVYLKVD